jgi:hypothetical protein
VLWPSAIADQASACAGVGAANVPANQSRVTTLNRASAADGSSGTGFTQTS